jgi:cell division protein FtsW
MRSARISVFVTMLVLICIGIVMIYSASSIATWQASGESYGLLKKQCLYVLIGCVAMVATMAVDYHLLRRFAKPLLIISVIPLLMVLVPGISREVGGASAGCISQDSTISRRNL